MLLWVHNSIPLGQLGLHTAPISNSQPGDEKLHQCAFFSHHLTPTEQNYDVGNSELLVLVLALQKLCHWLEGAAETFIVWTDHKNLSYLQWAKRLNSRQVPWALFLGCFLTLNSPAGPAPRMPNPMRCLASLRRAQRTQRPNQSFLRPASLEQPLAGGVRHSTPQQIWERRR